MKVSVKCLAYKHMALLRRANLSLADSINIGLLTEAARLQLRSTILQSASREFCNSLQALPLQVRDTPQCVHCCIPQPCRGRACPCPSRARRARVIFAEDLPLKYAPVRQCIRGRFIL
jgi:hypothetical protein